ncbi:MAG: hypothetical protein Q9166_002689 [cf. Caloplaca sp. 2 TL-2023]
MPSSDMSWTPSSSARKRKYQDYCDTLSHPALPHIPGAYPPTPVNYTEFGREMYLGTPIPESHAVYLGVSAPSHTPMPLNFNIPQFLRSMMYMVAGAATSARTFSTYTVGLLAGPSGRAARYIQHSAGPVFEAIDNTAKRIKLTFCPERSPRPATEPPTSPLRRISTNINVPPSASLPSQTAVLHNARSNGLRRLRSTLRWIRDQQHQSEASQQMLEYNSAQVGTSAHTNDDIATITTNGAQVLDHSTELIDADMSEDFCVLEAFRELDCDINTQVALHLAEFDRSVGSSDIEACDEQDFVGLETREEKSKRIEHEYYEELRHFEAERQAQMSKAKGVFSNPDIFTEKIRMVYDTAASSKSPKKNVAFYDSPTTGNPVTLTKRFNHEDPMTPPYRQHISNNQSGLVPALRTNVRSADPDVPAVIDHDLSPVTTTSPVSDISNDAADTSISAPATTTSLVSNISKDAIDTLESDAASTILSDHSISGASTSAVISPDTVASNLAILGFSNRRSTKRSSDLDAAAQLKREQEVAFAAEEAAKIARKEAECREIEEAKQAEERTRFGIRRLPIGPIIEPLTSEWEEKLSHAMRTGLSSSKELARTSTGEVIRRRDFGHVLPQAGIDPAMGWLNDTIVTAYLQVVVDYAQKSRDVKRGDLPKVHAMTTFFYDNLVHRGYDSVKRWATRAKYGGKNLFRMEKIFIPINKGGNHWVLVHVNPQSKTIEYFDSFHHQPGPVFNHIKTWLRNELGDAYIDSEWTLAQKGGPIQRNASDCGVFAITTAKMIVLGVDPLAFSAADMPTQRRRMLAELMNGGFDGDFAPNVTF